MDILEINQKIEVEVLTGNYKGTYLSKLADIIEKGIIITGLFKDGLPLAIKKNRRIRVYLKTERAVYKFESKVLRRSSKPLALLLIEKPKSYQRIQRRDHFRLEISGRIDIYQADQEKSFKAEILNISGGGVGIKSQKKFAEGEELLLDLKRMTSNDKLIEAVIVRKNIINIKEYNYGLEFKDIDRQSRENIIQWIFAYQRKNRQKGLN
ncbi:PilZ domain-containing protein [Halanaerobium sp. Z-7514]|uniref:PilZ domain-containing protein n=1 Tax=Halanaerobium polyolivorans TaxID=2886943 RepID=A0AAW4X065_9FIRM|nr:PilZ domain-containing protein [Halanaerobium polyolivorans]MCC3145186.1 PilZ domain-containing protein [Halanaerobium polyolivorans]